MERSTGTIIIVIGLVLLVIGGLVWLGAFGWFGRLPGDLRYEGENTRVYVPITSAIIVSIVASIVINLVGRLLR